MSKVAEKYPGEAIDVTMDFTDRIEEEQSVSLVTVGAIDARTGQDAAERIIETDDPAPFAESGVVYLRLKGGIAGEVHTIKIKVLRSDGKPLQDQIELHIL